MRPLTPGTGIRWISWSGASSCRAAVVVSALGVVPHELNNPRARRLTIAENVFIFSSSDSRLRFKNQDCCFLLVIGWSSDVQTIELRRPERGAGARRCGNLPDYFVMIRIFLLINVNGSHLKPSTSRGINTSMRTVIPEVVDSG